MICVGGGQLPVRVVAGAGARPDAVGQESGQVVRGDGLGVAGDEVGVVGRGECVDGLGGGDSLPAEDFGFAALCGVEDEDAVCGFPLTAAYTSPSSLARKTA